MESWANATKGDRERYELIAELFDNDFNKLRFLFDSESPRLRIDVDKILFQISGSCSSERLVFRLALDIWCGCGEVRVTELWDKLDYDNFCKCLEVFTKIKL